MGKVHETTIFRSGNSNAARLPKGFAVAGERVRVRRLAGGRTLIEPTRRRGWPKGFLESFGGGRVTSDFDAPARPRPDREAEARARLLFQGDDE